MNMNNKFNLYDFARRAGYNYKNKQYKDKIVIDRTKIYWDAESFTVYVGSPGMGGGTVTINCPAGHTWFITYGEPIYRYNYVPRYVTKVADTGNPFYEDGIEEKLGGEKSMLGGE